MNTANPFPGMNPFLENHWPDVHHSLLGAIRDALGDSLPPDLRARAEEQITIRNPGGTRTRLRPDVGIYESWKDGVPPRWQPDKVRDGDGVDLASEPQIIVLDEERERWLKILDREDRLVTVIEVLSPTNKGGGFEDYRARCESHLGAGANLVEIDLLRGGRHAVSVPLESVVLPEGAYTLVCTSRASRPLSREVYATVLRNPLPTIRIPLRKGEDDVVLALQPLIDRVYRLGRYWQEDFRETPGPAMTEADAIWVADRIREAGLE